MIGNPGLIRFAELVAFLDKNTEYEELEFTKHAFLPNRYCVGNKEKGRWVQLAVVSEGGILEVDYLLEDVGHRTFIVLDVETVAKRILSYLRKEVVSI